MVRDVNEPFVLKQTEDPAWRKAVYFESEEWGSAGDGQYVTGGVEARVSTLTRVVAAVGLTVNLSGGRYEPVYVSASGDAVKVALQDMRSRGSGVALVEAANNINISGVMQLSFLAFGE